MIHQNTSSQRRLIWVYPDNLTKELNSAPSLQITRGLRKAGWQVDLLNAGFDGTRTIEDVEVTGIPWSNGFIVKQFGFHLRVLKFILDRWGVTDIILFRSISLPWMMLLRFAGLFKRRKRPLLVMDTRTMPMLERTARDRIKGQFSQGMEFFANRVVDGQTAITPRMAEAYRIPPAKLWGTWPSGVDIAFFSAAAENRHWPKNKEPVQIVYIGVLALERDLLPLCQAVEKANQQGMRFDLTFVGDGRDRERLAEFAAHTEGRIRLLGRVPHEQIPAILSQMHVGTLPFPDELRFRVSSPIKLFEYLGSGMPVLATRIPCHTDVIGDLPCAFWAKDSTVAGLFDALRLVWEDRGFLADRGQMACNLAQDYSWAASTQKLIAAFEKGLGSRKEVKYEYST